LIISKFPSITLRPINNGRPGTGFNTKVHVVGEVPEGRPLTPFEVNSMDPSHNCAKMTPPFTGAGVFTLRVFWFASGEV
jgi:hypothetical protein